MAEFISVSGDILESTADALVNPVNCFGVMGAGLAKRFAERFPAMLAEYEENCKYGGVLLGRVFAHLDDDTWVINFPTKGHWKEKSKIEDIASGMLHLVHLLENWEKKTGGFIRPESIAIPKLGCGLGGLDWRDVRPIIVSALKPLDITVMLYEGTGAEK